VALENELRDHKQQAAAAKNGYADWTKELQGKLAKMREEKKVMSSELAAAEASKSELKVWHVPLLLLVHRLKLKRY